MSACGTTWHDVMDAVTASTEGRIYETSVDVSINEFDDIYGDILAETRDADHDGPAEMHGDHIGRIVDMWGETLGGDSFRIKLRLVP